MACSNSQFNESDNEQNILMVSGSPDSDTSMESLVSCTHHDEAMIEENRQSESPSDLSPRTQMHQGHLESSNQEDAVSVITAFIPLQTEQLFDESEIPIQIVIGNTMPSDSPMRMRRPLMRATQNLQSVNLQTQLNNEAVHVEEINHSTKVETANNVLGSSLPNYEVEAMGSIFREVFICPICQSEYCIDTGDPRTLKCGHSLCSTCLNRLFDIEENEVECAECRKDASYDNIDEIPVSFTIKQIITKYKEKKRELDNPETINENLVIHEIDDEVKEKVPNNIISLGNCDLHSLPVHFGCTTCEEWLCGTCVCLKHTAQNNNNCKVYQINEALQRKRCQLMEEITETREDLRLKKLHQYLLKIDAEKLIKQAKVLSNITQNFIKNIKREQEYHEKQEQWYKDIDRPIVIHFDEISSAKSPSAVKDSIDRYFKFRESLEDTKTKNGLFDSWRQFIQDASCTLKGQSTFLVSRKSSDNEASVVIVKAEPREVSLDFRNYQYSSLKLVMEAPFFNLSEQKYYAYIIICRRNNEDHKRIRFILDDNPLAEAFLKKCSNEQCSFEGTGVFIPIMGSSSICFGEKIPPERTNMINIGDRSRYLKPILPGSIGIFNNFENHEDVDVNNMLVYINMLSSDAPRLPGVHYISDDPQPRLKMCFGSVYEGYEELKCFLEQSLVPLKIIKSGVYVHLGDEE